MFCGWGTGQIILLLKIWNSRTGSYQSVKEGSTAFAYVSH